MTDTDTGQHVRPFAEFLQQQARGATHDELSQGMHDLLAAVIDTGKGGKVGLTVDVKPLGKGDARQVLVTCNVTAKMPAVAPDQTLFFVDDGGNLTRSDPRQPELPLQDVNRPAAAQAKAVNR